MPAALVAALSLAALAQPTPLETAVMAADAGLGAVPAPLIKDVLAGFDGAVVFDRIDRHRVRKREEFEIVRNERPQGRTLRRRRKRAGRPPP